VDQLFDIFDPCFTAYHLRGDAEIWRVHAFERVVTM